MDAASLATSVSKSGRAREWDCAPLTDVACARTNGGRLFHGAEAPGASGTSWWVDPREDLVVVWMAHSPGTIRWRLRQVINALVYQAVVD
jgi:CubicO group peptidase (beta-lactamase class C family)